MAMWGRSSRFCVSIVFGFIWFATYQYSHGQFERDLQIQQQELSEKINQSSKYLSQVRESTVATLQQLQVIRQNTADRIELVNVLEQERKQFDLDIIDICSDIDSINTIKDSLNLEYYTIVAANYKRQLLVTPVHLLFSTESLTSLLTENVHADQYKHYIDQKKSAFNEVELVSNTLLNSYEVAIQQNAKQQARLKSEKLAIDQQLKEQEALVKDLQQQESELKAQLQESKNYRDNINKRIELFIQKDVVTDRPITQRTTIASKDMSPSSSQSRPTSHTSATSVKNTLPVQGTVVGKFGRHRHPTLPDVYVVNNGIDIAVYREQAVYAVSGGTVMTIEPIKDGSLVLIDDGSIYHVYSPVRGLSISVGQTISRGQEIGKVDSELHLEIWDGKRKIDPEVWLGR